MAENERDTHFQGFARLLWDDIEKEIRDTFGFIPEGETMRAEFLPIIQKIIAQHAYDLVYHAFMNAPTGTLEHANLRVGMDEEMQYIPDLTAWPKSE